MRDILDYIEERAFCEGYEQRMFDEKEEKLAGGVLMGLGVAGLGTGAYGEYRVRKDHKGLIEAMKAGKGSDGSFSISRESMRKAGVSDGYIDDLLSGKYNEDGSKTLKLKNLDKGRRLRHAIAPAVLGAAALGGGAYLYKNRKKD